MISFIRDISVILAAGAAIWGVRIWRKSNRDVRKLQIAEDALTQFYQACDAIRAIRFPVTFGGEAANRACTENETDKEKYYRDIAYIIIERHRSFSGEFSKLKAYMFRLRAYFGAEDMSPIEELLKIRGRIMAAAKNYYDYAPKRDEDFRTSEEWERHCERVERFDREMWEVDIPENDEIEQAIQRHLEKFEEICRPILNADL